MRFIRSKALLSLSLQEFGSEYAQLTRRSHLGLLASAAFAKNERSELRAIAVDAEPLAVPANRRKPFGWPTFALRPGDRRGAVLEWSPEGLKTAGLKAAGLKNDTCQLRFACASDIREAVELEASDAHSGDVLGRVQLDYAYVFQPFELKTGPVPRRVRLRVATGNSPVWIFAPGVPALSLVPQWVHSSGSADRGEQLLRRVKSFDCVQPFGWMEGCVLDGLLQTGNRKELHAHFNLYCPEGVLDYEGPMERPWRDALYGVEAPLPLGPLALVKPDHPALAALPRFVAAHAAEDGLITDGVITDGKSRMVKTEECYTVAYPLAALGKATGDARWPALAIRQLQSRQQMLATSDAIFQRREPGKEPVYRNWARGVAWYLLGLARTLPLLPATEETAQLRKAFVEAAQMAVRRQAANGCWNCFLDESSTGIETSGSAGIAAALASGARTGLLPPAMREPAARAWTGLKTYITPDGFLLGASQANKGGEALQRGGFRVCSQYAMGLTAQLLAALGPGRR